MRATHTVSEQRPTAKLQSNVKVLLTSALDHTYKLAEDPSFRADPDCKDLYTRYDALDALIANREQVTSGAVSEIHEGFYTRNDENPWDEHSNFGNPDQLCLVEADEVDLYIAVTRHVHKAEHAHKEALLHLELRLEALAGKLSLDLHSLALHPKALYEAFQHQVEHLPLPVKGKIILCGVFAEQLTSRLQDFYSKTNQILAGAGILSDTQLIHEAIRARETTRQVGEQRSAKHRITEKFPTEEFFSNIDTSIIPKVEVDTPDNDNRTVVGSSVQHQALNEESLHSLFTYLYPGTDGESRPRPSPERCEVVSALSAVQRKRINAEVPLNPTEIREALKRTMAEAVDGMAREVTENEERAIDFVNEIFQSIFDDEALTDALKALYSKLQIPVIKIALIDFDFFRIADHPARRLLNELVELGVGVENKKDPLFKKLRKLINELLDTFDTDVKPFVKALEKVRKIMRFEAEKTKKIETTTRKIAFNKSRRSAAKRTVVNILNRYIKAKSLPDEAFDFILKCWAPYMATIYLKQGLKSEAWRGAVMALRQIIEASQPQHSLAELQEIIGPIDDFFSEIKGRLEQLTYRSSKHERLVNRMRNWFQQAIEHVPASQLSQEMHPAGIEDGMHKNAVVELLPEPEDEEDPTFNLMQNLLEGLPAEVKPGMWFEIYRGPDRAKRRLRLSMILEETGRILFTNHTGQRELEINMAAFLDDLRNGRTRLINDDSRFDRALNLVIGQTQRIQQACPA